MHVELLEESSSQQETSAVGRGIVGESSSQPPLAEFTRVAGTQHSVSSQSGIDHLGDHLRTSDSSHQSVFRAVVLVLVLDHHSLSGVVISLSFSSSSVLGLVSLEVSLSLLNLNEIGRAHV